MTKEMTKEELQEIQKHFEIANNQVRKQVDERNIIKGKLQAYQEIIEFLNKTSSKYDKESFQWMETAKNETNQKTKKEYQKYSYHFEGASLELMGITENLEIKKNKIANSFFK